MGLSGARVVGPGGGKAGGADLLSTWLAKSLSAACVLGTVATVLLCYGLALGLGHVRALPSVPMISDCFVEAPEKYPARFGVLVFGTVGLLINVKCMHSYVDRFVSGPNGKKLNTLSAYVGTAAAIGFGIVGAVNEKEDNPVHTTGALIGFFGLNAYDYLVTAQLYSYHSKGASTLGSLRLKLYLSIGGTTLLTAFLVFCIRGYWTTHRSWIASAEWLGLMHILAFILSFGLEFHSKMLIGDLWQNDVPDDGRALPVGKRP